MEQGPPNEDASKKIVGVGGGRGSRCADGEGAFCQFASPLQPRPSDSTKELVSCGVAWDALAGGSNGSTLPVVTFELPASQVAHAFGWQ